MSRRGVLEVSIRGNRKQGIKMTDITSTTVTEVPVVLVVLVAGGSDAKRGKDPSTR